MKLAVLCYIECEGHILMMHRNKRPDDYHLGKWNGLGGKFLPGESPEACLLREVYEESGLRLSDYTLRGIITFPLFDGEEDWYTFVYSAKTVGMEVGESDEGTLSWIPKKSMFTLNLWEGDKIFLDWIFTLSNMFSAVFYYKKGVYLRHEVVFYG